jgi:hypothetical protein
VSETGWINWPAIQFSVLSVLGLLSSTMRPPTKMRGTMPERGGKGSTFSIFLPVDLRAALGRSLEKAEDWNEDDKIKGY